MTMRKLLLSLACACVLLQVCMAVNPTTGAAAGISTDAVTLAGTNTDPVPVWIEYGTESGEYPWKTPTINVTGAFSQTIEGYPLISGETYYYRASNGGSAVGAELSFTLSVLASTPTATYSTYFEDFKDENWNISGIITNNTILAPLADSFGGGDFGNTMVFGLILGFIMIGLFIYTEGATIPLLVGMIGSVFFVPLLPEEIQMLAYSFLVIAVGGVVYMLIKGWRK